VVRRLVPADARILDAVPGKRVYAELREGQLESELACESDTYAVVAGGVFTVVTLQGRAAMSSSA
jgi:hypothetical protein